QLIVEPKGSTYHDPRTGAQVDSGTLVDIHSPRLSVSTQTQAEQGYGPLAAGSVNGSFRELALWTIDDNDKDEFASLNLRREPFADRPNAPNRFSSYKYGDPYTPLPRAYKGDPIVIRTINVSPTIDTLHFQGSRFPLEPRYVDGSLKPEGNLLDTIHYGVSEKYTLIVNAEGQGSASARPGDYLYFNGLDRRLTSGAWGLIRVMAGKPATTSPDFVQPLPDNPVPSLTTALPKKTGGNPPALLSPGNPCPTGAPARSFNVSAVDLPLGNGLAKAAYVPTAIAADAKAGTVKPEPLVLHAAKGECVTVNFTNDRTPLPLTPTLPMAGFAVSKLDRTPDSSGVNVGFTKQQYVTPGNSRTYVYYVDSDKIGTASIADFSTSGSMKKGLYGALVVAPAGAQFTDPVTGVAKDVGSQVDVQVPGGQPYRDFTVLLADNDARMGQDFMPYPTNASKGLSGINYRFAPVGDGANSFSWYTTGDIPTPVLRAYAGDPVQVHAIVAPGSEQAHVFNMGGQSWMQDPNLRNSNSVTAQGFGPWETIEAHLLGGAGGETNQTGDFFYGDLRRPFTQIGVWGWLRSLPSAAGASCTTIRPLPGRSCG
ncbi:MAG: hypothetical protein H0V07_07200, partial [Propionibacteriales bacterium]|nr:hypothetical protein [Propionibacteriales bacterium]